MPLLRLVGNVFALLLSFFSSKRQRYRERMRVVRRASLNKLLPLPNGMHFTPAMSARAILHLTSASSRRICHHERAGESKLHVLRDGLRFLRVIVEAAFLYRPSRPLGFVGALSLLTAGFLILLRPSTTFGTDTSSNG
jgi:hypothetical protein